MPSYDEINKNPLVENCHPKFIARIGGERKTVADVIDGVVYLTAEGKEFFAEQKPEPSKKVAKKVQSDNTLPSDNLNIDLEV